MLGTAVKAGFGGRLEAWGKERPETDVHLGPFIQLPRLQDKNGGAEYNHFQILLWGLFSIKES